MLLPFPCIETQFFRNIIRLWICSLLHDTLFLPIVDIDPRFIVLATFNL